MFAPLRSEVWLHPCMHCDTRLEKRKNNKQELRHRKSENKNVKLLMDREEPVLVVFESDYYYFIIFINQFDLNHFDFFTKFVLTQIK
jgi:hypothetical protein